MQVWVIEKISYSGFDNPVEQRHVVGVASSREKAMQYLEGSEYHKKSYECENEIEYDYEFGGQVVITRQIIDEF